jgi:hypothetical protein
VIIKFLTPYRRSLDLYRETPRALSIYYYRKEDAVKDAVEDAGEDKDLARVLDRVLNRVLLPIIIYT